MPKKSAGVLMYRYAQKRLEVMLIHPGGPFWSNKDDGGWSIPKGLIEDGEEPLAAALRELQEETGAKPDGEPLELEPIRQQGGKLVFAWAVEGDFDPAELKSNTFSMEWPPKSGLQQDFPEVDRVEWFALEDAQIKILKSQIPLLEQLQTKLARVRERHQGP